MSSTNIYLHLPIRVRAFSSREEGETVRLEEKPVKEVEVNEFDHKSFSCGSSLRAADAIYSRTITKSDRDKFVDAKAKVTPKCATPPSFICVPDVKPSGDNAFVKSIGIANVFTNVSPGNREVKLIVFHLVVLQLDSYVHLAFTRLSRDCEKAKYYSKT